MKLCVNCKHRIERIEADFGGGALVDYCAMLSPRLTNMVTGHLIHSRLRECTSERRRGWWRDRCEPDAKYHEQADGPDQS